MENKWKGLATENFRFENLGRPAIFLIPLKKLRLKVKGEKIEDMLRQFLIGHFDAFTFSTISNFGVWLNGKQVLTHDKCRLYEISFAGKRRITILGEKLAEIAAQTGEECIYFKAGQYSSLIYPIIRRK